MKLLEKEIVNAPRARPNVPARPAPRPVIAVRARVVVQPAGRRRNAALAETCNRIVAFAAILGVAYVGGTLAGYVGLEHARQSARQGAARAAFAQAQAATTRTTVEAMTNPAALRAWGEIHGFVPGKAFDRVGSGLVARR